MTGATAGTSGARRFGLAALGLVALILAALAVFPAHAQTAPGGAGNAGPAPAAPNHNDAPAIDGKADLDKKKAEYQEAQDALARSSEQRRKIETEIEAIRNDRAKLTAASIDAREKVEAAEAQLAATEERLTTLGSSEAAIRKSLDGRRDVLASVLAVLQRMGRRPPPALLTRPEDVLRAIRASMVLGAVLPQLRAETEALASDLQDLASLRARARRPTRPGRPRRRAPARAKRRPRRRARDSPTRRSAIRPA